MYFYALLRLQFYKSVDKELSRPVSAAGSKLDSYVLFNEMRQTSIDVSVPPQCDYITTSGETDEKEFICPDNLPRLTYLHPSKRTISVNYKSNTSNVLYTIDQNAGFIRQQSTFHIFTASDTISSTA